MRLVRLILAIAPLLAQPGFAQTYSVQSIAAGNVGTVAAGASGVTVFQIYNVTSKISGSGGYISGATNSPVVTINCVDGSGSSNSCANNAARVVVTRTGVNTGRGQTLQDIGVEGISPASVSGSTYGSGTGGTVDFVLSGWTAAGTRQFLLGVWLPILGDDSSSATTASSQFNVAVAKNATTPSGGTTGMVNATVRKALVITKLSDLAFGTILRPASGSGTVTIDPTTGARSAAGSSPPILVTSTSGRAVFSITGQPSSTITLSGVSTITLTSGANTLTVNASATAFGPQTLSAAGTFSLGIGGTITIASTTPTGAYSGTGVYTVAYN